MSFRDSRVSAFRAGVVALVLVTTLLYVVFGGHMPWKHPFVLNAVVSNAVGLNSRSTVRIAGVDVGHVRSVTRGPGRTALVKMEIDKSGLPIHRDATLKVRPRIFLEGNFFVDLHPGTPSDPYFHNGDTIPLAQTAVPVQFDEILSTLQSSTRTDLQQVVHTFAQTLDSGGARALHQMLPDWAPAFLTFSQMQQAVRGQGEHDLSTFIENGEKVSKALAAQDATLPRLVTGLNATLRATSDHRAQLASSVDGLARLVQVANPTLDALNAALPATRQFMRDLKPGVVVAPRTLRLATGLSDQLSGVLAKPELPALLTNLKAALVSISTVQPGLRDLLGKLSPVTECLRNNAVPVLKSKLDDGPLSSNEPVYRELLYALVGLASGSQNFTGDGPIVRYHAGFGDTTVTTGKVPGIDEPLVGLTSEPILGSRPKFDNVLPPLRPDVPCVTQKRPDLHAETGPAPEQRRLP
jgi:phospholipid/cholesterol/gamma-HCH transport system substrate-binding protein